MKLYYLIALMLCTKPSSEELVWEELTPKLGSIIPMKRRDCAIGYHQGENAVYIFGGKSTNDAALKDMYKFDMNTKTWTTVVQRNSENLNGRFSAVYGSTKEYLYIATGQGMLV